MIAKPFSIGSTQVDQVYSKSDRIVSPEFQLEVVQDLLKSSTPKGCAPASSDTSLQPGAEMGGAENGSRLPTRGDSVMSAFSRAHNAQLHTSSNDSGILLVSPLPQNFPKTSLDSGALRGFPLSSH